MFKSLLIASLLALAAFGSVRAASASTYYIGSATGTVRDGTSFENAWSLNGIDWSKVQPGDRIEIDCGKQRTPGNGLYINYNGPLKVGKDGITIALSEQPDHNFGNVSIVGSGSIIDLQGHSNVTIQGSKNNRLNLQGGSYGVPLVLVDAGAKNVTFNNINIAYCNFGMRIGSGTQNVVLKNVDIGGASTGLHLQGSTGTVCSQVTIHDNLQNVYAEGAVNPKFDKCWLYNSDKAGRFYRQGSYAAMFTGPSSGFTTPAFTNCVIGPGLETGLWFYPSYGSNCGLTMKDSLFIGCAGYGIRKEASIASGQQSINLNSVTMFQARTSPLPSYYPQEVSLRFFESSNPAAEVVSNSIVYDGFVNVFGTRLLGPKNYQYRTLGQTMTLSASQNDPKFKSDVSNITGAATFSQLRDLDFSLQSGSPAAGSGSAVTSVQQLLNSFQ